MSGIAMRELLVLLSLIVLELEQANQLAHDQAGVVYVKGRDQFTAGEVGTALGTYLG